MVIAKKPPIGKGLKFLSVLTLLYCSVPVKCQQYDAELLNRKTEIKIENGNLITDEYFEIKINNRQGEKYGKIAIPYSGMIKLSNVSATIKNENGKVVRKLKKSEITQRSYISDFSFYEDDFVKEFTLKHNVYPYIIEYSYTYKENEFIHIDSWHPVLNTEIPTHKATLSLSYPKDYEIKYTTQHVTEPTINYLEFDTKITWQAQFNETFKYEEYAPYYWSLLPGVDIVPVHFKYEKKGSLNTWKTYGKWQHSLLKDMNILPQNEIETVKNIVSETDTDYEKVRKLYHYLQDQTRYINVSIETGGLKPYPASYVANNKYGDCKALSNYFNSLLEVAEIKSYYTNIWAGEQINNIDTTFPSAQFNHIIVNVPLKNDTLWLDCTSDGPFNYLGTFTQGRTSFLINGDSSGLTNTPALSLNNIKEVRNVDIAINLALVANLSFKTILKGKLFEKLLSLSESYSENTEKITIRNHYLPEGQELIDYEIIHENRDSTRIFFNFKTSSVSLCKKYGNDIFIKNIPFEIHDFEKPENRKLPIQLDYPIYKIDTFHFQLPHGTKISSSLSDKTVQTKFGSFKLQYINTDGKITVIKELIINKGNYAVGEYNDFYTFIDGINNIEDDPLFILTQ